MGVGIEGVGGNEAAQMLLEQLTVRVGVAEAVGIGEF
jgi:hypothetical protein